MAIVFDSATNGSSTTGTSLTFSHTVTGSKTILFVGGLGSTASDKWTGVTYNGVAMTRQYAVQMGSDRWAYLYYLIAPATGANNVVISSASDFISGNAVSYSGVKQTGFPDASNNNLLASGTPNTNTLTTVADNSWHIMFGGAASGTPTAGTGSTIRGTANGNMAFFDGNTAKTPAGSDSIGMAGYNSSFNSVTIGVSIAPFVAVDYPITAGIGAFTLTGVSNNLLFGRNLVAGIGAYTLTGVTVALNIGKGMLAGIGSFVLTGIDTALRFSRWSKRAKNTTTWADQTKNTTTWTQIDKH